MNAYLLLENGMKIEGTLFGHPQNTIGELSVTANGELLLHSHETGHECIVSKNSASLKEGDFVFFTNEYTALFGQVDIDTSLFAKVIIDSMPIEYHLYDVKTYIPSDKQDYTPLSHKGAA